MTADFFGIKVKIPSGYVPDDDGIYIDRHGIEYELVQYGRGEEAIIVLETIYSKHMKTIVLEVVQ